jgi:beta-lactamase regulating signal transducer with metallopeptidase domain
MEVPTMEVFLLDMTRYLAAQSWQIAVLTAVVAAATAVLRHRSAHVRYLLWLIVVAKCLVPPLHAVPLKIVPPSVEVLSHELLQPQLSPRLSSDVKTLPLDSPDAWNAVPPHMTARQSTPRQYMSRVATRLPPPRRVLTLLWLTGVVGYLAMNLLRAVRGHWWLRRSRQPLPENAQVHAADLLHAYGLRQMPKIWMVEKVGQPFVWGWLRGSIYIPAGFLAIDSSLHRRDVLAHELSHVLRCDAAVNGLQVIAQGLFWFHPFVWWSNRQIRREREKCCDEMVIARLHTTPRDYSTAIVATLARAEESARPTPSLAVAGPLKSVERRIRVMLKPGRRFQARPSIGAGMAVALIAVAVIPTTFALTAKSRVSATAWTEGSEVRPVTDLDTGSELTFSPDLAYVDLLEAMPGTWLLYMTPQSQPEQGPDPIDVDTSGSIVSFLLWQKDYVMPISGRVQEGDQEGDLRLSGESVCYGTPVSFSAIARAAADVMTGTYSYSGAQVETGVFRAVKGQGKKAKPWVRVVHAGDEHFLDLHLWDLIRDRVLITSVTVTGPYMDSTPLPVGDSIQTRVMLGSTEPVTGDAYTYHVDYSDGTSEIVQASVRATRVEPPVLLSPADGDAVGTITPTFSWAAPLGEVPGYYGIRVSEVYGNTVWSTYLAKEATSVVYNSDGKGIPLTPGDIYEWCLVAYDPPTRGGPDNAVSVAAQFRIRDQRRK